jgi:hypothetical protein
MPYIEAVVVAKCGWELVSGFRSGVMHFGIGSISRDTDRRKDPIGYWLDAGLNAATVAACIYLIAYPR